MIGAPRVYQPMVLSKNRIVKAFRTWVLVYNSPSFTTLSLNVMSNLGAIPGQVIFTSENSYVLNDIATDAFAVKEIFFDFINPIFLRKGTYHLALNATDYVGDSSSHLGWVRGTPDPNNQIDVSNNTQNIARMPFYLGVIDGIRQ